MNDWWIRLQCRTQYREEGSTNPPKSLNGDDLKVWRDEERKIAQEEMRSAGAY